MIDQGKDIDSRHCPMDAGRKVCISCPECELVSGWGGAGAYSDGKLTLSAEIGGFLARYLDTETLQSLIEYVDDIYVKYGAPEELHGSDSAAVNNIRDLAARNDLTFIPSRIRHIGTDRCKDVLTNMRKAVDGRVDTIFEKNVQKIIVDKKKAIGIRLGDGIEIRADFIILAPGRASSKWLEGESKRLKLTLLKNPVDIGVRVEVPATVLEPLTRPRADSCIRARSP
jgi:uncharacterized FAD-dependent dehydrogenase